MSKPMINLVFAGHVDHGKSTLVGRIFHDLGQIDERTLARLKRHAQAVGKPTFYLAYFTDRSLEERQRGISIEVGFVGLETDSRRYNVIDAPGHKDFTSNMISGACEGDVAVLVVDAARTARQGAAPQTKEHLVLLKALGIERLVVAINKMDEVQFDKETFDLCQLEIEDFNRNISYTHDSPIAFVPVSAYEGDNVVHRSDRIPWYKGATLVEVLDSIQLPERPVGKPLRMPVLRAFSIPGLGTALAGKIETGVVKIGDRVVVAPYPGTGFFQAEVRSIEWQHKPVENATSGDDVGILLGKLDREFSARLVKKGAVVGSVESPPRSVARFKAEIVVVDHPTSIRKGYSPYLHVHQAAMPCTLEAIERAVDAQGRVKSAEENPDRPGENQLRLVNGDSAVVWIRPHKPLVIEQVGDFPRLGRLVLRDSGTTVATGLCLEREFAPVAEATR